MQQLVETSPQVPILSGGADFRSAIINNLTFSAKGDFCHRFQGQWNIKKLEGDKKNVVDIICLPPSSIGIGLMYLTTVGWDPYPYTFRRP
jgi:hypothetical protein